MKKLPTYIGVIIFVVTLLINWLLPSLAKVLNTFFHLDYRSLPTLHHLLLDSLLALCP